MMAQAMNYGTRQFTQLGNTTSSLTPQPFQEIGTPADQGNQLSGLAIF
jgi:hypothetical protein